MAVICDFKYGRGVEVEVEDNEQILSYAICLQKTMKRKFSMVHCFIYQPRTPGKEFNRWSIDENILAGAEQSIIANKEECLSLIGKDYSKSLCAGDWCRFCPAKHDGNCPEFNRDINSTQLKILDNVPEVVPTLPALTLEQKVEIFKRRKVFKKFIDEVCTDLLLTANSGVKVPGHKIVEGQRKRGWRKDTPMELIHADLMGLGVEQPMKLSLKGIGEIEKEIGKGKIGDLTELSKPTYQLVPDTDKRVEVKNIGLDEIEEIELE